MHRLQELVRLHRQGTSAREAARLLGMSRNTVSGYLAALRSAGLLEGAVEALPELAQLKAALPANVPPQQTSSIETWAPRVKVLLAGGAQPRGIYDLLRTTEPAFVGSLSAVKRLCARLQRDVGPRPRDVAIPVDTAAGEVAQVDFGYVGYLFDPARPYVPVVWKKARIHTDSHVIFDKRLYSVPYRYLHRDAWVRATPDTVVVYVDDERVATHDRRGPALRSINDDHLPDERVALRHRGEDFWTRRAGHVGGDVEELAREIFALESVLNPLRTVQAIVTLLEKYPEDRANNAAKRARHFGTRTYRGLLDMLRKGLDFEPLPPTLPLPNPPSNPRFARDIARMLTPENPRDWN